ncbi:MAG: hypothetical protein JXX28_19685 [Deltaproteobacteria bacterium]|nr:hypothetical protein [Deltaproteobacteria bacterium]
MASQSKKSPSSDLYAMLSNPDYDLSPSYELPATDMGNSANAQDMAQEGEDRSLADYVTNARSWLGSELWDAVSPHLTEESLGKYANKAVSSAVDSVVKYVSAQGGEVDPGAMQLFSSTLKSGLQANVGSLLGSAEGKALIQALRGWTNANAEGIAYVALLAAAGAAYYAFSSDMKVPELQQKLKLGDGWNAKIGAQLGTLQNLGVREIKAEIEKSSGPLTGAIKGDYTLGQDGAEDTWSVAGNAKYDLDQHTRLNASGSYDSKGDVKGDLNLAYGDKQTQARVGAGYADDKYRAYGGVNHKFNDNLSMGANAYAQTTDFKDASYGGSASLDYKKDNLSFGVNAGYDSDRGANVGVGLSWKF